jgi:prophage regulatory protein
LDHCKENTMSERTNNPIPTPSAPRIERPSVTRARVGLSKTAVADRVRAGTFPKPISLGGKAVAFVSEEIDRWIAAQIAARGA